MSADIRHPLFARFFDRFTRAAERELGPLRARLVEGLDGRVLELGAGNGTNFARYPSSVTEVVAIEPEPYLRAKAEQAAAGASVSVSVRPGRAGELDLAPGSFDVAVCSLVLCSVPDQPATFQELRRLLRPGGQLRFLEHVRGSRPVKVRLQRMLDGCGLWPRLFGGCHCGRDTLASLRDAGFEVNEVETLNVGPSWLVSNPHVVGNAIVVP